MNACSANVRCQLSINIDMIAKLNNKIIGRSSREQQKEKNVKREEEKKKERKKIRGGER